jgi:formate dehydrogenase major subunit
LNDARPVFESVWGTSIPRNQGLNLLEMMDSAAAGKLKAIWAIGYDIALTNANTSATEHALRSLDFVIVQDMFMNETARQFASVFLPATSSFERDGTFMNAERRIQRIRKAIEPAGQSRPDWEIICAIAKAMGKGESFSYGSAEEIWNEIRSVWPAGRGITYERLDRGGLQWPCSDDDHSGTEVMHTESFPIGKAALRRVPYRPTEEIVDEEFPFLLITGRTLYQFNAGTMTMRTANVKLRPEDLLDLSFDDAKRLKLHDGDRVRIRSRYGEATLTIRITSTVKPGELFATFHTAEVFLNRVTSPHRDRYVKSPEYKVTAVKIEKG